MIDPAEDLATEMAEDRAVEVTPHSELPSWPPNGLREALELFAEAVTTPREDSDGRT